jgi:uroporphyrinogen decarboxylase
MNSRDRVRKALAKNETIDRLPTHHEATPEVNQSLLQHFGLHNLEQLRVLLGDDLRYIEPIYAGPELHSFPDGRVEGYWGEQYKYKEYDGGMYLEPVYLPFAGIDSVSDLDESHFPTADWFDYSHIEEAIAFYKDTYALVIGSPGDMDFINSIGRARGMEEVFIDLITDNPAFLKIMDARFTFYFDQHEALLRAGKGHIDIAHIGEDLGNQLGPMISMEIFDKHFAPKLEKYFSMVHAYGAKTMMHMCGCVEAFQPRLIDLGLDIQDVVQPTTPEMDIAYLQEHYGDSLSFCGSLCVQHLLPEGTEVQIRAEVQRRKQLFSTGGLIIGPTHAIQVKTPLENIISMYDEIGSLHTKDIPYILKQISGSEDEIEKINLSKLF